MKKILSSVLASSMILSTEAVVFANTTNTTEIIKEISIIQSQSLETSAEQDFIISDNGLITGYAGDGGNVVIPSTIDGKTIVGIWINAFQNNTTIESITMPSTLERIEEYAFDGCTNLRNIELNEGLQYIGVGAFSSTTALSSVWFPTTLTEIGNSAFSNSGLNSVYVPETVKLVGSSVFKDCTRLSSAIFMAEMEYLPQHIFSNCATLKDVYLREGIYTINKSAFYNCTSLQDITLPTTIKTIGEYAFYGCSKIEKLDFTNTRLETVDYYAFQNCVSLTEVIFPYGFKSLAQGDNATHIDRGQFNGCSSLVKVVLPSTMTSSYYYYKVPNISVLIAINAMAGQYELFLHPFMECNPNLEIYSYPNDTVTKMASYTDDFKLNTLSNEDKNPTITPTTPPQLPTKTDLAVLTPQVSAEESINVSPETDFVLGAGGVITSYVGNSFNVVIPSTIGGQFVYAIGENAFQNNTTIGNITMPSTLERIENNAFAGCSNLNTVNLNEGLQYIGENSFATTRFLSSIWFPSTLIEIGNYAFNNSGLNSLYVPETVKIVGQYAFQECDLLSSVIFMADIDTLPRAIFYKCTKLTDVYLREGIVTIGRSAFNACTALQQITLPSTTKSIDQYAFVDCTALEKMDMTNTRLSFVGYYAFQKCTSLTEVIFPYGFTTFEYTNSPIYKGKEQFNGCTALKKIVIPSTFDDCYHYYSSFGASVLVHPFENTNTSMVVYSYPNTCIERISTLSKAFIYSALENEDKNPTITPTTPPQLPTAPTVVIPTVVEQVVEEVVTSTNTENNTNTETVRTPEMEQFYNEFMGIETPEPEPESLWDKFIGFFKSLF